MQERVQVMINDILNNSKKCIKCRFVKPLSSYYNSSVHKSGKMNMCMSCKREQAKQLKHKRILNGKCTRCGAIVKINNKRCKKCISREHAQKKRREAYTYSKEQLIEHRIKLIIGGIKSRAEKKHLEINIDFNFIMELLQKQNYRCAISNIEFEWTKYQPIGRGYHRNEKSMSIDRIDNGKGYTKDNVWLITTHMNTIKNKGTWKEFIQIIGALENHMLKPNKDFMLYDHGDNKTVFDNQEDYFKWMNKIMVIQK